MLKNNSLVTPYSFSEVHQHSRDQDSHHHSRHHHHYQPSYHRPTSSSFSEMSAQVLVPHAMSSTSYDAAGDSKFKLPSINALLSTQQQQEQELQEEQRQRQRQHLQGQVLSTASSTSTSSSSLSSYKKTGQYDATSPVSLSDQSSSATSLSSSSSSPSQHYYNIHGSSSPRAPSPYANQPPLPQAYSTIASPSSSSSSSVGRSPDQYSMSSASSYFSGTTSPPSSKFATPEQGFPQQSAYSYYQQQQQQQQHHPHHQPNLPANNNGASHHPSALGNISPSQTFHPQISVSASNSVYSHDPPAPQASYQYTPQYAYPASAQPINAQQTVLPAPASQYHPANFPPTPPMGFVPNTVSAAAAAAAAAAAVAAPYGATTANYFGGKVDAVQPLPTPEASADIASLPTVPAMSAPVQAGATTLSSLSSISSSATSNRSSVLALLGTRPVKPKRKRATPEQTNRLNEVFAETFFPTSNQRMDLAIELGMSPRTVQIWFQNKRQGWRSENRRPVPREPVPLSLDYNDNTTSRSGSASSSSSTSSSGSSKKGSGSTAAAEVKRQDRQQHRQQQKQKQQQQQQQQQQQHQQQHYQGALPQQTQQTQHYQHLSHPHSMSVAAHTSAPAGCLTTSMHSGLPADLHAVLNAPCDRPYPMVNGMPYLGHDGLHLQDGTYRA